MMDDKEFDQLMRRLAVREKPPRQARGSCRRLARCRMRPRPAGARYGGLSPRWRRRCWSASRRLRRSWGFCPFGRRTRTACFITANAFSRNFTLRPLSVTDASALRLTEVSALDAAWIEGRLTLSLRIAARNGQPLAVGRLEEDGVRLSGGQAENGSAHPSAPVLLEDGFACYTRPDDADGWPDGGMSVACLPDGGGVTLALQLPPDFLTASDLSALADGDAIPLRLEWTVYDPLQGRAIMESALLAAPVPTGAEKEEMNP